LNSVNSAVLVNLNPWNYTHMDVARKLILTSILPVLRYGLPNHNNNTTKNSTKII
jgi:hypothetical protein